MKVKKIFGLSPYAANCYAVISDMNNAVLIDAPCNAERILNELEQIGVTLKMILLTHGHFDHIMAVPELVKKTNATVYVHENDENKLKSSEMSVADYFGIKEFVPFCTARKLKDGDKIILDDMTFEVIHTPGHTSGCVCYKINDIIFTGDTLFQMSVGRCDMPDGNWDAIQSSVKKLSAVSGNFKIYPGHGEMTELDFERKYNPYL